MPHHSPFTSAHILQAVRLFKVITQSQLALYFYGEKKRKKWLETILPQMGKKGKIKVIWHRGKKVYIPSRKNFQIPKYLDHDLASTECLIRIWRNKMKESVIYPERVFRGLAVIPEWGICFTDGYQEKPILLFEYSTRKNFEKQGVIKNKIRLYESQRQQFMEKFSCQPIVLIVIDVSRQEIIRFIKSTFQPGNEFSRVITTFFFCAYMTFVSVPVHQQLLSSIYFWTDAHLYPLSKAAMK